MKKPKRKPKRTTLKNKLWSKISEYKRRIDADPQTGFVSCVTCGMTKHWKEMQAGHYVPQAQGDAARYELDNVWCQCYRCNINLGGNGPEYTPFMIRKLGQKRVEEIRRLAGKTIKFTLQDLEEKIEEIEEKLCELEKQL